MAQKPRNADYTKEYNCKVRHNAMRRAELALATGLAQAAAGSGGGVSVRRSH